MLPRPDTILVPGGRRISEDTAIRAISLTEASPAPCRMAGRLDIRTPNRRAIGLTTMPPSAGPAWSSQPIRLKPAILAIATMGDRLR